MPYLKTKFSKHTHEHVHTHLPLSFWSSILVHNLSLSQRHCLVFPPFPPALFGLYFYLASLDMSSNLGHQESRHQASIVSKLFTLSCPANWTPPTHQICPARALPNRARHLPFVPPDNMKNALHQSENIFSVPVQ